MDKHAQRTATVAWSPQQQNPALLAAGTVAGAVDLSFSSEGRLEIFDLGLDSGSPALASKASIETVGRFHKLCWSPLGCDGETYPYGLLAGGMDNGTVNVWNPNALLNSSGDPLVACAEKHTGPVQGLDFNPFQANLLASGANDAELYIWDLSNPTKPTVYSPGQKNQQSSSVSAVAWNRKVQHILASTSANGVSVVWDLKVQKPVISFHDRQGQQCRDIVWNPDVATQVITVSENDNSPGLLVWDLRNAMSPVAELKGHSKGILAAAWHPKDSELLLTAGKDNRTLCWNPKLGTVVMELPLGDNWVFDVAWCPRDPDLLSTCSFDGKLHVYSIMDSYPRDTSRDSTFIEHSGQEIPSQLGAPPGWLKRPAAASFGFGGTLVNFGPKAATNCQISLVATENAFLERAARLEGLLDMKDQATLKSFCADTSATINSPEEKKVWDIMGILFEDNPRVHLLEYLGFNPEEMAKQVDAYARQAGGEAEAEPEPEATAPVEPEAEAEAEVAPASRGEDPFGQALFGGSGGEDDPFSQIAQQPLASAGSPAPEAQPAAAAEEVPKRASAFAHKRLDLVVDDSPQGMITRALMCGNWAGAVDICFATGREADGLLMAAAGGKDLYQKTRDRYMVQHSDPFMLIVAFLVQADYAGIAERSDLGHWREALALIASYAPSDAFSGLCDTLGQRLLESGNADGSLLCFMCAGNVDMTLSSWLDAAGRVTMNESALQVLVEKVIVFRQAANHNEASPLLDDQLCDYVEILASQGKLVSAYRFLSLVSPADGAESRGAVLRDRVFKTGQLPGETPPPFPFQVMDLYATAPGQPAEGYNANEYAQQYGTEGSYNADGTYNYGTAGASTGQAAYGYDAQQNYGTATAEYHNVPYDTNVPAGNEYSGAAAESYGTAAGYGQTAATTMYETPAASTQGQTWNAPADGSANWTAGSAAATPAPPAGINIFNPAEAAAPAHNTAPPVATQTSTTTGYNTGQEVAANHFTPAGGRDLTSGYGDAPIYDFQPNFIAPVTHAPAQHAPAQQPAHQGGGPPSGHAPPRGAPPPAAQQTQQPPPAAAPPVRRKSAPGDVSQVEAHMKPAVTTIQNTMQRCSQAATRPIDKRKMQDVGKKVNILFQQLNDHEVDPMLCQLLQQMAQAIDGRDYNTAQQIQVAMLQQYQEWMPGLKFMLQIARNLG